MPFKKPPFPATLTNANWQKKKGNIAKIAGTTGIGPALEELEHAYNAIDWKALDVNAAMPQGKLATSLTASQVFTSAKQEYTGMVEGLLRKKLKPVVGLAKQTTTKWEKKALIPKSSVKAVKDVTKAAEDFMDLIASNQMLSQITQDYNSLLASIMKKEDVISDTANRLKKYCLQIVKGARAITTADEFNGKFWSESIRGVGTTLPPLSVKLGIVAEHKAWRKFTAESFKAKNDDEVMDKLREMIPVLKKIATAVASFK